MIAIVCLALGQPGDLRGEGEKDATAKKIARELAAKLDELDEATARFEKAEDEAEIDSAARQAGALLDWLVEQAKTVEKHFSALNDKEIGRAAAELRREAGRAKGIMDSFFMGKTSRPKVVAGLKEVRESGDEVLALIGDRLGS